MASCTSGGECLHSSTADPSSIPVVVAKCGLHLKEEATEVEGTFRISGSAKRLKELQDLFDMGPRVSVV
jgi:hypothetical protein